MSNPDPNLRVPLGRTGILVSPICYGSWQLSPRFWGEVPADDTVEAMRVAFDLGINFYDNADAYGEGYAETVMGKALADLPRDQIVIATKVFHHWYPDLHRHGDLSREYIFQACDASLKRLKLDYIDVYQCHSFDQLADMTETVDALDTLVRKGKIRAYGTSNWTVEQLRLGDTFGNFATCQPPYSLIRRAIEDDILPYCRAKQTGVLVYSPLQNGLLTGKFKGNETFTDLRASRPDFQGDRFKMLCDRMAEVGKIAKAYNMSTVQLVLTVTLMHPAITCAIVGIKSRRQIEEAAGATGRTISRDDWYKVRELLSV